MMCVTHEMGFARRWPTCVVFMDQGEIVERRRPRSSSPTRSSERTKLFLSQILSH